MNEVINKIYDGRKIKVFRVKSNSRKNLWHTVTVMENNKMMCSCEYDLRGEGVFRLLGYKWMRVKDCPHIKVIRKRLDK